MAEEGTVLLTWIGGEEETGAELLLQALEYVLWGGEGRTDRHTDIEQDGEVGRLTTTTTTAAAAAATSTTGLSLVYPSQESQSVILYQPPLLPLPIVGPPE